MPMTKINVEGVRVVDGRCDDCRMRIFPGQTYLGNLDDSVTYHEFCERRMRYTGRPRPSATGWHWSTATVSPIE